MNILLKGYYGWGNLGDDILMKVVYLWLKKEFPSATIDIFSGFTKNNSACKPDKHLYHTYIQDLLPGKPDVVDWTTKKHYDLLVQGGGGIHFDHSHGGKAYAILNKAAQIIGAPAISKVEQKARVLASKKLPITFSNKIGLGIGVGNFNSDSKRLVQHASEIGEYDFLWVRDDLSLLWLDKLSYRGKYIRSTDLAFDTQSWIPNESFLKEKIDRNIGFVSLFKDTLSNEDYLKQIHVIKELKKCGYNVSIYLFQEIVDAHLIKLFSDVSTVKVWDPHKHSLEDYLIDFGNNKVIISGRAHGVILGACMSVPTITLETSTKLREVSLMFPNSTILINKCNLSEFVVSSVNQIISDYERWQTNQLNDVNVNKENVKNAFINCSSVLDEIL